MSDKTAIEWTDATWNPITGCTEVSAGCDHCYAKTFAERWRGTEGHYFENGFDVQLRPDKLDQPLRWKRPRRIFVNSMSDLFHDQVPDDYIAKVFAVMAVADQHTFQLLTKRHGRMRSLLNGDFRDQVAEEITDMMAATPSGKGRYWPVTFDRTTEDGWNVWGPSVWPLPNVWLGVSAENQQWADIRIPALLDTPAAVRFISAEPLLDRISLLRWLNGGFGHVAPELHWVIAGGESGAGFRPILSDWVRELRDECVAADVAFLFKQWGGRTPKARGRELDGRTWDQYPEAVTA